MKILFVAEHYLYRDAGNKVNFFFMNALADNNPDHEIKIIYTDCDLGHARSMIQEYRPEMIMFFESRDFQGHTRNFAFVFDLCRNVWVFLDDSYYITSTTSICPCVNRCDGIVFWYKNEKIIASYQRKFPGKKILSFASRYVNTDMYKDYRSVKKYDILIYGTRRFMSNYGTQEIDSIQEYIMKNKTPAHCNFYPLREKLEDILQRYQHKYVIVSIPPATCTDARIANEELSRLINESHLTVACSSIADVLFHKHLEIAASGSVILGNCPSDYAGLFERHFVKVTESMSEEEVIGIIDQALSDKTGLAEMGRRLYDRIHSEHNLRKAQRDFNRIVKECRSAAT